MRLPFCEKCQKEVDRLEMRDDIENDARQYDVYCHGETERTIIPWKMYMDMTSISVGVAFRKPLELEMREV